MKAIILNLLAWSVLPIMDGLAKHLSTEMHFLEVVWGRYVFMLLLSFPFTFLFFRKYLTWPKNVSLQIIRGVFLFLSTLLFFLCHLCYLYGRGIGIGLCCSNYSDNFVCHYTQRKGWGTSLGCCNSRFLRCFNYYSTWNYKD